jgi:hypothetical protein
MPVPGLSAALRRLAAIGSTPTLPLVMFMGCMVRAWGYGMMTRG